jgi:hypothetical protein
MHGQIDPLDLIGRELVLAAELQARVDRRVHHDAAGKRFVGIEQ